MTLPPKKMSHRSRSGGCFTKVWQALEDILSKFVYYRNRNSGEKFKLKLCTWAQSIALGTRTKFQLKILTIDVISDIVYFGEIILESSRNLSETTPRITNIKLLWLCQSREILTPLQHFVRRIHRSAVDSITKSYSCIHLTFSVVSLNRLLNKQSSSHWFQMPRCSCHGIVIN